MPSASSTSTSTPSAPAFALVTFAPVWLVMPCLRNDFSSSADTASSSIGTRRGSSSTIVTSLPKRLKIDANSTPTAPLPMITMVFGTSRRPIASSLVMMRLRSISMPGTPRGADPVATMISSRARSVCCSPSNTSTPPLPVSRAVPLIQSILFFLNRNSTPLVRPVTTRSLRVCTWLMSMVTAAPPSEIAPVLRVLRDLERVGMLEQRLGRNAAPQQAGAAERLLLLDHGGLQTELRGANGGDVSAGSRADDDDVVFLSHVWLAYRFNDERGMKLAAGGSAGAADGLRLGLEPVHTCT